MKIPEIRKVSWFAVVLFFILIDQFTKWLAVHWNWSIFLNHQFAFSLPVPGVVMAIIYILVLVGIAIYIIWTWHRFSRMQKLAWAFVCAGGLSNIGERIVLSHVRDFIPIANGMLNVADLFIIFGLILLLVSQRYSDHSTTTDRSENF